MKIPCTKHGEVEARVDAYGDAWCPECLEEGVRALLEGNEIAPPVTPLRIAGFSNVTSVKPTHPPATPLSDAPAGTHPPYQSTFIRKLPGTRDDDGDA